MVKNKSDLKLAFQDQVDHVVQEYTQLICVCQTYLYIRRAQVTVKTNPRHNVEQGIIDSKVVSSKSDDLTLRN